MQVTFFYIKNTLTSVKDSALTEYLILILLLLGTDINKPTDEIILQAHLV